LETGNTIISKEDIKRLLDVEKLKYCYECGICKASCSMAETLGKDYKPRTLLERIFLNPENLLASEELWPCAWCYSCNKRCPQALRLPEIFLFIRENAIKRGYTKPFEKALKKIVDNIPLPLVNMFVCFHPERAGLNINKVLEQREKMRREQIRKRNLKKVAKCSGKKIAVIGSGPAGLTVASELAKKGCAVTVFEALNEPGGMLRKCIPEYRLSKRVLQKDIQFTKDLGVDIRSGLAIGKDLRFDALKDEGNEAIFVGVSAHKCQDLNVEGRDLKGIVNALDFLWNANCISYYFR
jgi:NADPH-dependent glutamate synthase beta subunit-like oxidoreductase